MEKILSIKNVDNIKVTSKGDWYSFDGYEIITERKKIQFLITNGQSCCESFGVLDSADNIKDFVGANLLGIERVDKGYNTKMVDIVTDGLDEGGVVFINVNTNRGTLQLAAYNSHNGYYGHDVLFVVDDKIDFEEGV